MTSLHTAALAKKLLGITGMRLAGAAATFVFSILVGRLLAVDDAGRVFWVIAVTSFLAVVARCGLDKGFIKAGALFAKTYPAATAASLVWRGYRLPVFVASLLLSVALLGYGAWVDHVLDWKNHLAALAVASASILGVAITLLGSSAAIGSGLVRTGTVLGSPVPACVSLAAVSAACLAGLPLSLMTFCTAYAAGWLTSAAALALLQRRHGRAPALGGEISLPAEAKWFAAIGISNTIEQWGPALVAGTMLSAADSANFALCARLVAVVQLIMVSATATYAHMYAAASPAEVGPMARRAVRSLTLVGLPVIAVLFLLAPLALSVFGENFSEAASILRIMLVGQVLNMALGTFSVLLMMRNHVPQVATTFLASSAAQVSLAVLGAHLGSAELLAASSVAAIAIHTGWCFLIYRSMNREH